MGIMALGIQWWTRAGLGRLVGVVEGLLHSVPWM